MWVCVFICQCKNILCCCVLGIKGLLYTDLGGPLLSIEKKTDSYRNIKKKLIVKQVISTTIETTVTKKAYRKYIQLWAYIQQPISWAYSWSEPMAEQQARNSTKYNNALQPQRDERCTKIINKKRYNRKTKYKNLVKRHTSWNRNVLDCPREGTVRATWWAIKYAVIG